MQTQTETNGKKKPVGPSSQAQIPGTETGSKELREAHEAYAQAKYEAKEANDRMSGLKPRVIELMEEEEISALSVEIDYGDERRTCVTSRKTKSKLSSKLTPLDDD